MAGSPIAYCALFCFLVLFVWKAVGAYEKTRVAKKKVLETEAELRDLNRQKSLLTADIENANTDFGKEKALREKFNVVREGEKVIMIVPEKKEEPEEDSEEKKTGIAGFFQRLFKD